jgi:hypothetical protein
MVEGSTHCNDTGNVVFATLVSWLLLRYSTLQGTPPGTVRDRVAPRRSTRKSTPTVHADHAVAGDAAAGTR